MTFLSPAARAVTYFSLLLFSFEQRKCLSIYHAHGASRETDNKTAIKVKLKNTTLPNGF